MSGYYRNGEWLSGVVGESRENAGDAERAVTEATQQAEAGKTTARRELKRLLNDYPSLKLERPNNPLKELVRLYAREVLT